MMALTTITATTLFFNAIFKFGRFRFSSSTPSASPASQSWPHLKGHTEEELVPVVLVKSWQYYVCSGLLKKQLVS